MELSIMIKSPLTPLFQRGEKENEFQRVGNNPYQGLEAASLFLGLEEFQEEAYVGLGIKPKRVVATK
jgi:hypothetical protein